MTRHWASNAGPVNQELFDRLFDPGDPGLEKQALDAINDFTRVKMQEDGFYRRLIGESTLGQLFQDRYRARRFLAAYPGQTPREAWRHWRHDARSRARNAGKPTADDTAFAARQDREMDDAARWIHGVLDRCVQTYGFGYTEAP